MRPNSALLTDTYASTTSATRSGASRLANRNRVFFLSELRTRR